MRRLRRLPRNRALRSPLCAAKVSHMAADDRENIVDPLWYKGAVIYELHVKTFCDGGAAGTADVVGVIKKLDYLQDFGITALCLLPFYPSPLRDDGYDIA